MITITTMKIGNNTYKIRNSKLEIRKLLKNIQKNNTEKK